MATSSSLLEGVNSERAYEAIRSAILTFRLHPGYPISETNQAKQLGMSRTPVREAIRRLTTEGLLESVPYKGTYVKIPTKTEVREVYEMSEGLEGNGCQARLEKRDRGRYPSVKGSFESYGRCF